MTRGPVIFDLDETPERPTGRDARRKADTEAAPAPAPEAKPAPTPEPEAKPAPAAPAPAERREPDADTGQEARPQKRRILRRAPDPAPKPPPETAPKPQPTPAPTPEPAPGPAAQPTPAPPPEPEPAPSPAARRTARPASERQLKRPVTRVVEPEPEGAPDPSPATAPPVPEPEAEPAPTGQAMQTVAALAARRASPIARLFWWAFTGLVAFIVSVAAWDFVTGLLDRSTILGTVALSLLGLVLLALALLALREMAAFARLRRLDDLHKEADAALAAADLGAARKLVDHLIGLYRGREDTRWGREKLAERAEDIFDADALLAQAETDLLAPLDAAAIREIEAAARQVAAVTALVPIALADLFAALTANLRMIRRIAEIYGGRGGILGSLRLTRAVMTHLVATGAVAVGDDLIGTVAGGGMLARVSRRFGEGVVNGALTARVGVAAMEVCRPLPFRRQRRPSVSALVKRALTGVFNRAEG